MRSVLRRIVFCSIPHKIEYIIQYVKYNLHKLGQIFTPKNPSGLEEDLFSKKSKTKQN